MTTYSTETITRKRQTYHVFGIFSSSSCGNRSDASWLLKTAENYLHLFWILFFEHCSHLVLPAVILMNQYLKGS